MKHVTFSNTVTIHTPLSRNQKRDEKAAASEAVKKNPTSKTVRLSDTVTVHLAEEKESNEKRRGEKRKEKNDRREKVRSKRFKWYGEEDKI